jgi:16S rRNA (uracil1498-N3)-methyltransferase
LHRFAIAPEQIDGRRVTFDHDETRHLARVLRVRPGDLVLATDGRGHEYTVRIESLGATAAGTVLEVAQRSTESPVALTLVQAVPKGDKMDTIIRAATELGVARIVPAIAARTVVRMEGGRWRERAQRWQRIAREAAKQSGRTVIPEVLAPTPLPNAVEAVSSTALRVCLWEAARHPLLEVLQGVVEAPESVALVVGPEGGLASDEVEHAQRLGWMVTGLGPRILRTETASLVAVVVIQASFGDILGHPEIVSKKRHGKTPRVSS